MSMIRFYKPYIVASLSFISMYNKNTILRSIENFSVIPYKGGVYYKIIVLTINKDIIMFEGAPKRVFSARFV